MPESRFRDVFPRNKYQADAKNPLGYIHQRVENPDQEQQLEGDWFDTPREAVDHAARNPPAGTDAKDETPAARVSRLRAELAAAEEEMPHVAAAEAAAQSYKSKPADPAEGTGPNDPTPLDRPKKGKRD